MPYDIRPAREADVTQLAEIEKEAFPTNWPPSPFRRDLANKMVKILVAGESLDVLHPPLQGLPEEGDRLSATGIRGLCIRFFKKVFLFRDLRASLPYDPQFLVGYVAVSFMSDEAHITAIAVKEQLRGKGVGELLLIASIEQSLRGQSSAVTLEVRVSNYVAQSLYIKYGFNRVGLRKRYYTDNNEDAYIMTTDPIASLDYTTRFRGLIETYTARRGQVALVLG